MKELLLTESQRQMIVDALIAIKATYDDSITRTHLSNDRLSMQFRSQSDDAKYLIDIIENADELIAHQLQDFRYEY